jgi:hypothetical protein
MRKNSKSKKTKLRKLDSGEVPVLTHEQTITWLDGMRELMFEVWRSNPEQIPHEKKKLLKDWLRK